MTDLNPPAYATHTFLKPLTFRGYIDAPLYEAPEPRGAARIDATYSPANIEFSRRSYEPVSLARNFYNQLGDNPSPIRSYDIVYRSAFGDAVTYAQNSESQTTVAVNGIDAYGTYYSEGSGSEIFQPIDIHSPTYLGRACFNCGPGSGSSSTLMGLAEIPYLQYVGNAVYEGASPAFPYFSLTHGYPNSGWLNLYYHERYNRNLWCSEGITYAGGAWPIMCEWGGNPKFHPEKGTTPAYKIDLVPDAPYTRFIFDVTSGADAHAHSVWRDTRPEYKDNWCIQYAGNGVRFFYLKFTTAPYDNNNSECDNIQWSRGYRWLQVTGDSNDQTALNMLVSNLYDQPGITVSDEGYCFSINDRDLPAEGYAPTGQLCQAILLLPDYSYYFFRFSNPTNNSAINDMLSNYRWEINLKYNAGNILITGRQRGYTQAYKFSSVSNIATVQLKAPTTFSIGCRGGCFGVPVIIPKG